LGTFHADIVASIEGIVSKDVSYMPPQSNLKNSSPIFFFEFSFTAMKKNFKNSPKIEFWGF